MSSNASNIYLLTESELLGMVPKFTLYIIQGGLIALLNIPIFLCIWCFPLMRDRKEYLLLSALAFTDALNGLACLVAGVGRNIMIYMGTANTLRTRLQCLLMPWNLLWLLWDHSYGTVLALISADRLIMLCFPLKYLKWKKNYAYTLLLASHLPYIALITYVVLKLIMSELEYNRPAICYTDWVYPNSTYFYLKDTQSVLMAVASVVIYVLVVAKYRQSRARVLPQLGEEGKKTAMKQQQSLTVTLGFSCCCTFVFHILPLVVKQMVMWVDSSNSMTNLVFPYLYLVQNLNALCNFGLYMLRHGDLRLAVKCLFQCKPLTQNLIDMAANMGSKGHQRRANGGK